MNLENLRKLVNEVCDTCDAGEPHQHEHPQQQQQHQGKEEPSGGKMARTDLVTIAKDAQELVNMFGDDAELDDWVEAKITKAADYINSVKKHLGGEIVRQHGGLMEAGYYKNPDRDEIDSGIGKKAMGSGGDAHEKMRSKAKTQDQLSKDFLASRPGSKSPRARKMLINKYKKMGLKKIPPFDVSEEEGGLEEGLSSLKMKQEEQMHALASAATSGMARLKDPAGVRPTVLDYFFENKEDKMGFLDEFHTEIQRELKHHVEYEERFARDNPETADKLKKGEEQPSLGLEEQREVYLHLEDATYDDGTPVEEDVEFWDDVVMEAEYQGRKVTLNKPMKGDVKKSKVYVKNEKGNVIKVNFGDPNMKIKKSNPKRRKSFRARHNCDNPGPKTKARYWSCRAW